MNMYRIHILTDFLAHGDLQRIAVMAPCQLYLRPVFFLGLQATGMPSWSLHGLVISPAAFPCEDFLNRASLGYSLIIEISLIHIPEGTS